MLPGEGQGRVEVGPVHPSLITHVVTPPWRAEHGRVDVVSAGARHILDTAVYHAPLTKPLYDLPPLESPDPHLL